LFDSRNLLFSTGAILPDLTGKKLECAYPLNHPAGHYNNQQRVIDNEGFLLLYQNVLENTTKISKLSIANWWD